MRLVLVLLAVLGLAMAPGMAAPAAVAADSGYVLALEQQPGQYSVDINVDDGDGWWANPIWIGAGVVALILLIVIIALATRGGGTTVIKE